MKLIRELLLDLSDTKHSLSGPLLKTKILVRKLSNDRINTWLDCELRGYRQSDELPHYRFCHGVLKATYVTGTRLTGFNQVNNQPLAIPTADVLSRNSILSMHLTDGIATLESFVVNGSGGVLTKQLNGEICDWLSHLHRQYGDPTFSVISANVVMSPSVVQVALDHIRNNLLDFIIELDKEYGEISMDELVRKESSKIDSMARKTIINQYGDAPIANSGDNVAITSSVSIKKGDKKALRAALERRGVEKKEVDDLFTVLDEDSAAHGRFGTEVSSWVARMMQKAASGGWDIGIGAAGNLLGDALSKYYGG